MVQFTDLDQLAAAAASLPESTVDREALTLQVPGEAGVAGLRRVLDRLHDDGVTDITVTSADLDDVFLALTGHAPEAAASTEVLA